MQYPRLLMHNENVTCATTSFVIPRDNFKSFTFYRNPGTKLVGVAFKLRKRMKNSPSCTPVLYKTLNFAISRCSCFAEVGKKECKTQSD